MTSASCFFLLRESLKLIRINKNNDRICGVKNYITSHMRVLHLHQFEIYDRFQSEESAEKSFPIAHHKYLCTMN